MLALNRGESLKILSVKMIISDWLQKKLYNFCQKKWLRTGLNYALRTQMFVNSLNDAYSRLSKVQLRFNCIYYYRIFEILR